MNGQAGTHPTPIAGVRLAVAQSNTRYKNRNDLTLIEIAAGGTVHCLFTRNKFCAAPVLLAKEHASKATARYLIINAGNANAGTGSAGILAAREVCAAVATSAGCRTEEVLPFSTGIIGQPMNTAGLNAVIPELVSGLTIDGWDAAAAAIMTTDTRVKIRSVTVSNPDIPISVTGIAKGSGMIKPDMATLLAYVATNATIAPTALRRMAELATARSFNRITVDGDTSTNDAFALIASGAARMPTIESEDHPLFAKVLDAIVRVSQGLAQDVIRDGEGATKFVTVKVSGGATESDCAKVAYAVAESPLVKTALFASDANWGRILAAVGRAGIDTMSIGDISITIGDYPIVIAGEPVANYEESRVAELMRQTDIDIAIVIGLGLATTEVWTCDLSYDYVRINGEYRS